MKCKITALETERFTRRHFMAMSASFCGALVLPHAAFAASGAGYYVWQRDELMREFDIVCKGAQAYLGRVCDYTKAREIVTDAMDHFASLLPGLPDIGGEENMDLVFLIKAAHYYAFYRAMKPRGLDAEKTGRMMYDLCAGYYAAMPKAQLAAESDSAFSRVYREKLEKWCDCTRKREYPANWVASFIKGDGKVFNYGYDMNECAICKYFRSVNAFELQPYFCNADFPRSIALGSGLVRTKAIGYGDACCDFRYLRGRKVEQNWDVEIMRLHQ